MAVAVRREFGSFAGQLRQREINELTFKEKKKNVIYGCIYLMKIIKKKYHDFEEDFTFFSSWKAER